MLRPLLLDYLCGTNDDGWLVGGGEGGDGSYVLHNPDSAHIEVVHIGSGSSETGGTTRVVHTQSVVETCEYSTE